MNSYKKQTDKQIIVSLTSYPKRIHIVSKVLDSLYEQSMKADKILLWLAKEEFPNLDKDLPERLIDDKNKGKCEICWCDNIGSHKKYFYTMQEYPDDIVITVDDDTIYHQDVIRTLYELHCKNPKSVVALFAKLILFDQDNNILPYNDWLYHVGLAIPSMQIIPMGSGGVLYPPHVLDKGVFDKETILNTCKYNAVIYGDDVWLKTHALLAGTPTVTQERYIIYNQMIDTNDSIAALNTIDQQQHERLIKTFLSRKSFDKTHTIKDTFTQARENGDYHDINSPIVKEQTYQFILDKINIRINNILNNSNNTKDIATGFLHYYLSFFTMAMTYGDDELSNEYILKLKELILKIPNINELVRQSKYVQALTKYGAVVLGDLSLRHRQLKNYYQMLNNWKKLLSSFNQKNIPYTWLLSYMNFLRNMQRFSGYMSRTVYSSDQIENLKTTIKTEFKAIPLKMRLRFLMRLVIRKIKNFFEID